MKSYNPLILKFDDLHYCKSSFICFFKRELIYALIESKSHYFPEACKVAKLAQTAEIIG